jgi:hypothetical protein
MEKITIICSVGHNEIKAIIDSINNHIERVAAIILFSTICIIFIRAREFTRECLTDIVSFMKHFSLGVQVGEKICLLGRGLGIKDLTPKTQFRESSNDDLLIETVTEKKAIKIFDGVLLTLTRVKGVALWSTKTVYVEKS